MPDNIVVLPNSVPGSGGSMMEFWGSVPAVPLRPLETVFDEFKVMC